MNEQYAWLYEDTEERIRAVEQMLKRPQVLDREIERNKARIRILRSAVNRYTARIQQDRIKSAPDPARLQDMLAEAIDAEQEILRLEGEREQAFLVAAEYIADIVSPEIQRILVLHYLKGMD